MASVAMGSEMTVMTVMMGEVHLLTAGVYVVRKVLECHSYFIIQFMTMQWSTAGKRTILPFPLHHSGYDYAEE